MGAAFVPGEKKKDALRIPTRNDIGWEYGKVEDQKLVTCRENRDKETNGIGRGGSHHDEGRFSTAKSRKGVDLRPKKKGFQRLPCEKTSTFYVPDQGKKYWPPWKGINTVNCEERRGVS